MRYVQRDPITGVVVSHFANEQSYAHELLPDNHPDLLAYQARRTASQGPSVSEEIAALTARIAVLERKTALLP